MTIELVVEVCTFAPNKLGRRRFVIELNEFGEARIRYAGDGRIESDASVAMHLEGASVVLKVESKP